MLALNDQHLSDGNYDNWVIAIIPLLCGGGGVRRTRGKVYWILEDEVLVADLNTGRDYVPPEHKGPRMRLKRCLKRCLSLEALY
jgi:hypothetical protein